MESHPSMLTLSDSVSVQVIMRGTSIPQRSYTGPLMTKLCTGFAWCCSIIRAAQFDLTIHYEENYVNSDSAAFCSFIRGRIRRSREIDFILSRVCTFQGNAEGCIQYENRL